MKKQVLIMIAVIGGAAVIVGGLLFIARGTSYNLTVMDPHKGADDAPVVIEEFSDFQCNACAAAYTIIQEVVKQYPNQVKFVYRDFPLPSHFDARPAAVGALCAAQQGKFFEFHDRIFDEQAKWSAPDGDIDGLISDLVGEFELDRVDFELCQDSRDARNAVQKDFNEGAALGVDATPTFFVDGEKVENPGSLFSWMKLIDNKLEEKGLTPETKSVDSQSEADSAEGAETEE